ncbi:MAG: DNA polymerase III subunit gamma/tau, partial [Proteobacteria bacterium]|nr:DNA polymerase III subunit gamma/tau [Pseudomonadota bacterium]
KEITQTHTQPAGSWNDMAAKLSLDGAAKMLADHCELSELSNQLLKLKLHPKQKPLLNEKNIERIREAVSKHLGRDLRVEIAIDSHIQNTPAALHLHQQNLKQQAAENTLLSDPVVQKMIHHFDATLITNYTGEKI